MRGEAAEWRIAQQNEERLSRVKDKTLRSVDRTSKVEDRTHKSMDRSNKVEDSSAK